MRKDNIQQALKLYGRSYLAGIIGGFTWLSVAILMYTAFRQEGAEIPGAVMTAINLIALFLEGGLFFLVIYGKLWALGDRDSNAAAFGNGGGDPLRGLKIGLLAAIPSFVSWLVLVADKLFGLWDTMLTMYRLGHLGLYGALVMAIGPNFQTTTAQIGWGGIVGAALPVLFMPTVAALAYYLGYRNIVVWERLMFVRKKK